MIRFFDTSALLKVYVREPGSAVVAAAVARENATVARLAQSELAAAIARAARDGRITEDARDRLLGRIEVDFTHLNVVELRPAVFQVVRRLVVSHPLRALDAIQLASAIVVGRGSRNTEMWCTDDRLLAAARAEGLSVKKP